MTKLVSVAVYVNAVCLLLITLYVSIMSPTFNMAFYERQFIANGTHAMVRIEPDDLTAVTRHMLDYMRGRHNELQIRTYIAGTEQYFFTERAVAHMVDVKNLFTGGRVIFIVSVVLFVLSLTAVVFAKEIGRLFKAYRNAAVATAGLFAAIAVIGAANFDFAFEWFHHIFFFHDTEMLWQLYWHDNLLNIVPTPFFISISIYIGLLYAAFLALMVIGGEILRRVFNR